MTPRTRWLLIAMTATVIVGAGLVLLYVFLGQAAWWAWTSQQALDADEAALVEQCGEAEWRTLIKVLEQDLDAPCPPTWFAESAKSRLKKRHRQRARWIRDTLDQLERPPRTRFRAGTALLMSDRAAPPDLVVLADLSGISRPDLAVHAAGLGWPIAWMDPDLRDEVRRIDADLDDVDSVSALVRALRRSAVAPRGFDGIAPTLAGDALSVLGMPGDTWDMQLSRRASGLTFRDLPASLQRELAEHGEVCRGERRNGDPDCLLLLADVLEREAGLDPAGRPVGPPVGPPTIIAAAFFEARQPSRPGDVRHRVQMLVDWAQWVSFADPEVRSDRLFSLLMARDGAEEALASGVAEPGSVIRDHRGGPWTVAATATSLGRLADVPVVVALGPGGVWITVGQRTRVLDDCGRWNDPIATEVDQAAPTPEPWPASAIWAQAAVEGATSALLRSQPIEARRMALLAERLDNEGTNGIVAAVNQATPTVPDQALAAEVLALIAPPLVLVGPSALDARQQRAEVLRSLWAPRIDCAPRPSQ